jgi:hypothetical protein
MPSLTLDIACHDDVQILQLLSSTPTKSCARHDVQIQRKLFYSEIMSLVVKGLWIDVLSVEHIFQYAPLVFSSGAFQNLLH